MEQNRRLRVAIVYGGRSAEHEVSILSARHVLAALDRERFEPMLIGITPDGRWLAQDGQALLASAGDPRRLSLSTGAVVPVGALIAAAPGDAASAVRPDVVFPVLHGTLGEDGAMQGLLEMAGLPYVGAGILGSAIGMDKDVAKRLLRDAGIPVAEFQTLHRHRYLADPDATRDALAPLGYPLFTKPANAGSSVGVRKVRGPAELDAALRHAFEFDDKVIAERAVEGREIELAVLGGAPVRVSVAGEIVVEHADGFYSYDAKYVDADGARLLLPAPLSPDELARAQALAARTFEVLDADGMARVDLFLTRDGVFLVNEINTIPGFTAISMYPKLWELSGVGPKALVSTLIDLALARAERTRARRRSVAAG